MHLGQHEFLRAGKGHGYFCDHCVRYTSCLSEVTKFEFVLTSTFFYVAPYDPIHKNISHFQKLPDT